jgi:serine/threonine protein kinase
VGGLGPWPLGPPPKSGPVSSLIIIAVYRSAEYNDFIAKCLVKDPEQRASADQLLQVHTLKSVLQHYH